MQVLLNLYHVLVEDFVYDDINLDSGNQMISAGLNNLFGEIMWFYPTANSSVVNKMVCYNYQDSSPKDLYGQ